MKEEIKNVVVGVVIGGALMYGWNYRSMTLAGSYGQGQMDVVRAVCPPVVEALIKFQQNAQQQQPQGPKTLNKVEKKDEE